MPDPLRPNQPCEILHRKLRLYDAGLYLLLSLAMLTLWVRLVLN